MKFWLWSALLLILNASVPALRSAQLNGGADSHVILISVDGLASYYLDDPKARLPNIRKLAREGAVARKMRASFPSVTWPCHTTLVTGVEPGKHGVIGNSYFDRQKQASVPFIPDPLFDKDEIVKVPTVYDVAHAAGLKTAGVIWPAARNAKTLTWQLPDVAEQALWDKYATPGLLEELRAEGIPIEKQEAWCKAGDPGKSPRDWMYALITNHLLRKHRPNLLLLHLVTVDAFEHTYGRQSPEAYWACSDSDNRIGEIKAAVEQAGLKDRTTFFIVSDHGFITYTNEINVNVLLKKEGLLTAAGPTVTSRKAYCLAQGGGAFLYILDQANKVAILSRLKELLAKTEGVEAVLEAREFARVGHQTPEQDQRLPDLMLSARDGYSFNNNAAGENIITPTLSPKGSHGYLATHPLMYASFVASGAGVKKGVVLEEVRSTDVAPTIAALFGLKMENVEGRVLREIIAK